MKQIFKNFVRRNGMLYRLVSTGTGLFNELRLFSAVPRRIAGVVLNAWGSLWYRNLSTEELLATRKGDIVFIFGSGHSLNEISEREWRRIEEHDTISFREFPRQEFVRADYHVTGEVDFLEEYARMLRENPLYSKAVLVVQEGWKADAGNLLIGRRLLPPNRVYRYKRRARGRYEPPSRSFSGGVVHGFGSVTGMINFAYLMGWKHVVLVGVDLYDKRYFWLPRDQMRTYEKEGVELDAPFYSGDQIADMVGRWSEDLRNEGVTINCYNPKSLLAREIPVFDWEKLKQ